MAAAVVCLSAWMLPLGVSAGVSNEEAVRLKTDLTPLGAEKAGNKDGTIPAWTGSSDGKLVQTVDDIGDQQAPYYMPDGAPRSGMATTG